MKMLYKNFYLTKGAAQADSSLVAYDLSLLDAGFNHNVVAVSSILPEGAAETEPRQDLEIGKVIFCVLSKIEGRKGETISAGIAYAFGTIPDGRRYGIVAEEHGNIEEGEIKKILESDLIQMARAREMKLEEIKYKISTVPLIEDEYGWAVAALVYH